MAEKIITSHAARLRKAKEAVKNSGERISIFDREAYVEFYLLEDIVRLYKARLSKEIAKNYETRAGLKGRRDILEQYAEIIRLFQSAIELSCSQIDSGNFKIVWKSIHEGALMTAASNVKNLPELKELAVEMLQELSSGAVFAKNVGVEFDEAIDDIEAHEANLRAVYGLPSGTEIDEIISEAEQKILGKTKTTNGKNKPITE